MRTAATWLALTVIWSVPVVAQGPTPTAPPECAATASCTRSAIPKGSPNRWISQDDYPANATGSGNVSITLVIDVTGKPVSCVVRISSGLDLFDQTACTMLQKRARFSPALDAYGRPIVGQYETRASFTEDCGGGSPICLGPNGG